MIQFPGQKPDMRSSYSPLIIFLFAAVLSVHRWWVLPESDAYWDWETFDHIHAALRGATLLQAFPDFSWGNISQGFLWYLFYFLIQNTAGLSIETLRFAQEIVVFSEYVLIGLIVLRVVGLSGAVLVQAYVASQPLEPFWSRTAYFPPFSVLTTLILLWLFYMILQNSRSRTLPVVVVGCALSSLLYFPTAPVGIGISCSLAILGVQRRRLVYVMSAVVGMVGWLVVPSFIASLLSGELIYYSPIRLYENGANPFSEMPIMRRTLIENLLYFLSNISSQLGYLGSVMFWDGMVLDVTTMPGVPPERPLVAFPLNILWIPFVWAGIARYRGHLLVAAFPVITLLLVPSLSFNFHVRHYSAFLSIFHVLTGIGGVLCIQKYVPARYRNRAMCLAGLWIGANYLAVYSYLTHELGKTSTFVRQVVDTSKLSDSTLVICHQNKLAFSAKSLIVARALRKGGLHEARQIVPISQKRAEDIQSIPDLQNYCEQLPAHCQVNQSFPKDLPMRVVLKTPVRWIGSCAPSDGIRNDIAEFIFIPPKLEQASVSGG